MTRSSPLLSSLPAAAAALVILAVPSGAALAGPGKAGIGRLTPAQQQKVFPEMKSLALKERRSRIAILQRGERCISGAGNADALRDCMRQERSESYEERKKHRDEMRRVFERNGIPMPEWGRREGKGRP